MKKVNTKKVSFKLKTNVKAGPCGGSAGRRGNGNNPNRGGGFELEGRDPD